MTNNKANKALFRKILIVACMIVLSLTAKAQRRYAFYFASSYSAADLVFNFCERMSNADIVVNVKDYGSADLEVCFVDRPMASSIDYRITTRMAYADKRLYITDKIAYADVKINLSNSSVADIRVRFREQPTFSTTKIYLEDCDHTTLSLQQKIALLYAMGLIKK